MNIYLILVISFAAAGFLVAAVISVSAYKAYMSNEFIRKENDESILRKRFFTLLGYTFSKVMYAALIVFIALNNVVDYEAAKIALGGFGAAALVTMIMQGNIIQNDVVKGALDKSELYSKTVLKVAASEAVTILALIYVFIKLQ